MATRLSINGTPQLNLNDRVSPLRVHHHVGQFFFRYTAATAIFTPQTTLLTFFVSGIDDTSSNPWIGAGITASTVPTNSIDVTSTYKGGAFSITDPVIILSVGITPENQCRLITNASGDVTNTTGTPTASRTAGTFTDLNAMYDDFWGAMMHGSFLQALPPGNNTSCATFLGRTEHMISGMGMSNAPVMSFPGQNRREARFNFATEVFAEANTNNQGDFNPNRISMTNGSNVTSVTKLPALTAPADTDWLCFDLMLTVEYARVTFGKDAQGNLTYEGVEDIDKQKILYFRDSVCAV